MYPIGRTSSKLKIISCVLYFWGVTLVVDAAAGVWRQMGRWGKPFRLDVAVTVDEG